MGDVGESSTKRQVHVLVTGAGEFREYKNNPSNLIATALPERLALLADASNRSSKLDIRIYATPEPWKVSYVWVDEHVPPMLFPPKPKPGAMSEYLEPDGVPAVRPNYDIVLFIGQAAGRDFYTLETNGHRGGYKIPDADNKLPADPQRWARQGLPESIKMTFDPTDLHTMWKDHVKDEIDVQISDNAGHYLCDYIFYTGLSEYWKQNGNKDVGDRPVMFLHVPGDNDKEGIRRGVLAAEGLIRAMAVSWAETQDRRRK